jgi:hypothetical protein
VQGIATTGSRLTSKADCVTETWRSNFGSTRRENMFWRNCTSAAKLISAAIRSPNELV